VVSEPLAAMFEHRPSVEIARRFFGFLLGSFKVSDGNRQVGSAPEDPQEPQ
jgi:hypothetical protein